MITPTDRSFLSLNGYAPGRTARWAIHSALLAQVDDMHAGGVYSWGKPEVEAAEEILSALTGCEPGGAPESYGEGLRSQVLVKCLLVPLFDLDHPELSEAEWAEAEALIELGVAEFGR
jgi:hypothetical protein